MSYGQMPPACTHVITLLTARLTLTRSDMLEKELYYDGQGSWAFVSSQNLVYLAEDEYDLS
jgi:hypothetical protein